jgi:hypothetical protein
MVFSIGRERSRMRGKASMAISMPFIYGMIFPLVLMDVTTQLYQAICFPLYGIALVDRSRYVFCSRRAAGLRWIDRFNCWYCAYANGSASFVRAVLAETEKYWCPIRHLPKPGFESLTHHKTFVRNGDVSALQKQVTSYPYTEN